MKTEKTSKPGFFLEVLRVVARPFFGTGLLGLPGLRSIASWYRRAYRPEFVLIAGNKLYLNNDDLVLSAYLASHGYWAKRETEVVKRYVKPGMKVLDIGANVGYHTLLMSSLVGESGRVVAFEPDVKNFTLLSKSVAELTTPNVQIVQAAVWDTSGELQLYVSNENPGDHQVYSPDRGREGAGGTDRAHYTVKSVTIDDFVQGETFDFLKMDIQGAEGHAFQGMRATLAKHTIQAMILEFWPHGLTNAGTPAREVYDFIIEHGYTTFKIDESIEALSPISFDEIIAECTEDWRYVTLLCTLKK